MHPVRSKIEFKTVLSHNGSILTRNLSAPTRGNEFLGNVLTAGKIDYHLDRLLIDPPVA